MKMPIVIMSDGAVDRRLIEQGGQDVEGLYVTHALRASEYKSQGYKPYGYMAYGIAEELIRDAEKRFASIRKDQNPVAYWFRSLFNIHQVADARAVLKSLMLNAVATARTFRVGGSSFRFRHNGTAEGPSFHVWKVEGGQFVDAN